MECMCVKFCVKLWQLAVETNNMLNLHLEKNSAAPEHLNNFLSKRSITVLKIKAV
jgi:hypothetical protein